MTARGKQSRLENHHDGDGGDDEVDLLLLMSIGEREGDRAKSILGYFFFVALDPDTKWIL